MEDADYTNEPKFREYLHWLLVNIPATDIKKREILTHYKGTKPGGIPSKNK